MRYLLAVLLLACTPAAAKTPSFSSDAAMSIATVTDSTFYVKTKVYIRNWVQATDTIRFDYYRNDTLVIAHRSVFTLDSALVTAPDAGKTATYKGCSQVERKGRSSGITSALSCWTWVFTRDFPLPIIDSVVKVSLRPMNATAVALGAASIPGDSNKVQYCAFGTTKSGRKVKMQNSWNLPACEVAYQSWIRE